jgi:Flp pilus assembly protein TadD
MNARTFSIASLLLLANFFSSLVFAAGSDDYSAATSKPAAYNQALNLIKGKNYSEAIIKLQEAENQTKSDADIQNLLGFSSRKSGKLDEAAKYYEKALSLDPKHKGALEYQGELFLMLGDKASAEKNLQKLDKICWLGCSELDDLRTAIRKYKP